MTSIIVNGSDEEGEKGGISEFMKGAVKSTLEPAMAIDQPGMRRTESSEALKYMTLHQLARDGDSAGLSTVLEKHSGQMNRLKKFVNTKDEEKISPLHYAARYNHAESCKVLIKYQADANSVDEDLATPLHYAARYKRQRIKQSESGTLTSSDDNIADQSTENVKDESSIDNSVILFLISKGANVNAQDRYGCTPLHFAAMRGNEVATVELLSCPSIDIEIEDKQKVRALHLAVAHSEKYIVELLIESGAQLGCKDEDEGTPLHLACMEGNCEIAEMIINKANNTFGWPIALQLIQDTDMEQNTPLHLAVENGSLEVTQLLLNRSADVNLLCKQATSALHLAAQSGNDDIVKLLLTKNAKPDSLNSNAQTPLHIAASHNRSNIVELLLDHEKESYPHASRNLRRSQISRRDRDGYSPLLFAAEFGHAEVIHTLMRRGASLKDTEKNDRNAIFLAAQEDQMDALKALMNYLDEENVIDDGDRYSNTALHAAAEKGFLRCVKLLLENNADIDAKNEEEQTPLHLAAKAGKTNVVRELVRVGGKRVVDDEDEDSNTPLHLAALAGNSKVAQVLIEANANISARNTSQWTPLDCAAAKGWPKTCTVLLENDAPVDPKDRIKSTPLHLASAKGHCQVVHVLLKWKADIQERQRKEGQNDDSGEGDNCLDLAIDNGHKDVALAIIGSDNWEEALKNDTTDSMGRRTTPMRKLIRKMPEVAEKVFSKCVEKNGNPESPEYSLTFNWEYLDDMYSRWSENVNTKDDTVSILSGNSSRMDEEIWDHDFKIRPGVKPYSEDSNMLKVNHPLMIMVESKQEDLLGHPLVTSLLRHKWNSFGRIVYYLNLLLYCVFLVFLTGYVVVAKPPYWYFNETDGDLHGKGCTVLKSSLAYNSWKNNKDDVAYKIFVKAGKWIIIGLSAFSLVREMIQIYHSRWQYLLVWENLLEWGTGITAILAVIDVSSCQEGTEIRESWQWQLLTVAIFLAWMELVLFIRKLPRFGIYVVMFTDVLRTFTQFFPVFFLFIVAFALGFFCLFQNQVPFQSFGASLIKTSVMMIGEFEFEQLFLGPQNINKVITADNHKSYLYYPGISYVLFVFFLILMSVIIMNLLVGLAVDDIKAVQDQAVLKRLAMQVELALDVERILPEFIRRRFVVKKKTIKPQVSSSKKAFNQLLNLNENFLSPEEISKALDADLDEIEVVQENQQKMMKDLTNMKRKMKEFTAQTEKLEMMLGALLKAQNVDYLEEDVCADEDI
ncbi:DgyrCDS5882 [Dimorphilus gyrociliatus]|uniref:DgyrCDS5882 n=1 Tax=Dimorphilus gyrociliatus TaxID=2664684 RepID=A0A7I8VL92_9ANNE|nr:DgyrCDS5882 [Dimorphilus gyrociliatus]